MNAIEVESLSKKFTDFSLQDVTLTLPKGYIMGLIGANGAGKTTLIKILMGLYLRDQGIVNVLGLDPVTHGKELRNRIGFVFDNPKFYDFKLTKIKKIIAPFYKNWDEKTFCDYLTRFKLKGHMRFKELSRGMKLKFALAIALSHQADLLILDEPTSGLDPVFRLELLDILQEVIADGDKSVLFSSHITSDVEKIADYVTYIRNGRIEFSQECNTILSSYLIIKGPEKTIPDSVKKIQIGGKETPYYYEALIPKNHGIDKKWQQEEKPTLEQVMFYYEKRGCQQLLKMY